MVLKPAEGFSVEPRSITGNQDNGYSDTRALWGKTGGGKYTVGGMVKNKTVCGPGRCGPGWCRSAKCKPEQRVWTSAIWTRVIGVRAVGVVRAKAVGTR